MHGCYIKFDYVRISLTCEKYWYVIHDVISTNSSQCEIYEVGNLQFNRAYQPGYIY